MEAQSIHSVETITTLKTGVQHVGKYSMKTSETTSKTTTQFKKKKEKG